MNKSAGQKDAQDSRQNAKMLINYLPCQRSINPQADSKIAQITLNKPDALNALDIDMVVLMLEVLNDIRKDDSITAVFIDSAGEKAFCAGGDIVSMYRSMTSEQAHEQGSVTDATPEFLQAFFTQEYRLDYCLHTFPKPVIAWGNGIIMGGGLGLFTASHIKLVTESARIAMPEITIGLFPDVGGSYFLNRLPAGIGLFLGLTAAHMNAQDAIDVASADALIAHQYKAEFLNRLCQLNDLNKAAIIDLAASFSMQPEQIPAGNLSSIAHLLRKLDNSDTLYGAVDTLSQIVQENPSNQYLQKAFAAFKRGSPITAHLVFQQLIRAKSMSLADCFRMELSMAFTCGALGEFREGVRALLIDKDKQSAWQYKSIDEVPESIVDAHFTRFADASNMAHPLATLEQDFGV